MLLNKKQKGRGGGDCAKREKKDQISSGRGKKTDAFPEKKKKPLAHTHPKRKKEKKLLKKKGGKSGPEAY